MVGIEVLAGVLGRGVIELISVWDKKDERKHELDLFDKQNEADKIKAASALKQTEVQGAINIELSDANTLVEAIKAQAAPTGNKFIDGLNASVRPVLTYYWCIILYTVAKTAQFIYLTRAGADNVTAILNLWGPFEEAIVATMIGFWFADRAIKKFKK